MLLLAGTRGSAFLGALVEDVELVLELDDALHVRGDHEQRESELLRSHTAHGAVGGLVELDVVLDGVVEALHAVATDAVGAEPLPAVPAELLPVLDVVA